MSLTTIDPLRTNAVVDSDGRATPFFARLWQGLTGNGETTITIARAAQSAVDGKVDETRRVDTDSTLTGGGDLSADLTLGVDVTAEAERIRDVIGTALTSGTGITLTVDDPGDTITVAVDTTTEAERIRDVIGSALVAGSNITITVNDPGDTITIASTGGGGSGGSWIPLVTGVEPPAFMSDGAGNLILVGGP